jgi:hypothetical protein
MLNAVKLLIHEERENGEKQSCEQEPNADPVEFTFGIKFLSKIPKNKGCNAKRISNEQIDKVAPEPSEQ